jgi:CRP/FNR family transcriptional regulator, anaerobic regulatory protein
MSGKLLQIEPIQIFLRIVQIICPEITDQELQEFTSGLAVKHYKSKEFIFDYSKPQSEILYITEGLVRSFYVNENGSEISAYFVKELDFVSDYPAFLKNVKSNYTFQALENTTVVVIPKSLILKTYNSSPKFEKFGRLIAEEAVQFLQGRVDSFIFKTATERYLDFIEKEPDFFARLSVEHIATYLGIERQSLTRIRKQLSLKSTNKL